MLASGICCDFFHATTFLCRICNGALGRQLSESKPQLGLGVPWALSVEWCFVMCLFFSFFLSPFPRGGEWRRHKLFMMVSCLSNPPRPGGATYSVFYVFCIQAGFLFPSASWRTPGWFGHGFMYVNLPYPWSPKRIQGCFFMETEFSQ